MTQAEVGKLCGVDYQNIQNLENGSVTRPRYISKLAEVFGVTTDFLFNGESALQQIDNDRLQKCISVVQKVISDNNISINTDQQAKLVAYLYAEDSQQSEILESKTLDLTGFFTA